MKKTLGKGLANDEGGCTEKNAKDRNRKWIDNGYTLVQISSFMHHYITFGI